MWSTEEARRHTLDMMNVAVSGQQRLQRSAADDRELPYSVTLTICYEVQRFKDPLHHAYARRLSTLTSPQRRRHPGRSDWMKYESGRWSFADMVGPRQLDQSCSESDHRRCAGVKASNKRGSRTLYCPVDCGSVQSGGCCRSRHSQHERFEACQPRPHEASGREDLAPAVRPHCRGSRFLPSAQQALSCASFAGGIHGEASP